MTGILGCERGVRKFLGCERGVEIAAERIGFDVVTAPHAADNDHSARERPTVYSYRKGGPQFVFTERRSLVSTCRDSLVIVRRLPPTVQSRTRATPGITAYTDARSRQSYDSTSGGDLGDPSGNGPNSRCPGGSDFVAGILYSHWSSNP